MAYSTQRTTSDGTLVALDLAIEYLDRSEIAVILDGVVSTAWSWVGTTEKRIEFPSALALGTNVLIVRTTDLSGVRHVFEGGAAFTYSSIDENYEQILHIAQEARENATLSDIYSDINMHGFQIKNTAPATDPTDLVTFSQFSTHDAQIVIYRDKCAGYAAAAEASALAAATSEMNAAAAATATITAALGVTVQPYDEDTPTIAATQLEMETGLESGIRSMSPLLVAQAVVALSSNHKLAGDPIQSVESVLTTVDSGTVLIPYDDTRPTSTEGDQYLSVPITPTSATNKLRVSVSINMNSTAGTAYCIAALFRDADATALAASAGLSGVTGYVHAVFDTEVIAGSTAETVFKVRAGGSVAGTMTINGVASARKLGGALFSSIRVTEIKV